MIFIKKIVAKLIDLYFEKKLDIASLSISNCFIKFKYPLTIIILILSFLIFNFLIFNNASKYKNNELNNKPSIELKIKSPLISKYYLTQNLLWLETNFINIGFLILILFSGFSAKI